MHEKIEEACAPVFAILEAHIRTIAPEQRGAFLLSCAQLIAQVCCVRCEDLDGWTEERAREVFAKIFNLGGHIDHINVN